MLVLAPRIITIAAEIEALLDGITLYCAQLGIIDYVVEIDSAIVYNMVNKKGSIPWHLATYLSSPVSWHIKLVYREQNLVVDSIAKEVHPVQHRIDYFRVLDVPVKIRKLLFLDRIGLFVFRAICKYGCSFSLLGQEGFFTRPLLSLFMK